MSYDHKSILFAYNCACFYQKVHGSKSCAKKCQLATCDSISSMSNLIVLVFAFHNNNAFKLEIVCFPHHENKTIMYCRTGMCKELKIMISAAGFNQ